MNPVHLEGKTLILTGASMGIGRALALELAAGGVNLVLNARHASPLDEVAAGCERLGVQVRSVVGSAAEAHTAAAAVQAALELGEFFGFIQVAGVLRPGPTIWEILEEDFREVFEASVHASYQMVRAAVPELLKRGEGIAVFFGSGAAVMELPGLAAYSAAKAAEEHLMRQLAAEAPQLTSFVFRPGVVDTRMQTQVLDARGGAAEALHEEFRGYRERGELLSPERAAGALVRILTHTPRRFHGKVASWRDGVQ